MAKILIVEDDKELNNLMCTYFEQENFEVTGMFDAISALKTTQETNFDIILSDIMMPFLDGFAFAKKVRERDKNIPFVFMSARDDKPSKQLGYEIGIDDVKLNTSAGSLEIVFNNLISNAIKFTGENGKIDISLKQNEHFCTVEVKDNGCGIDKETGKHIFDKFYQGDTSHSQEGNGLGLALVKRVIDNLGGEISVESEPKKGSAFRIKLKKV